MGVLCLCSGRRKYSLWKQKTYSIKLKCSMHQFMRSKLSRAYCSPCIFHSTLSWKFAWNCSQMSKHLIGLYMQIRRIKPVLSIFKMGLIRIIRPNTCACIQSRACLLLSDSRTCTETVTVDRPIYMWARLACAMLSSALVPVRLSENSSLCRIVLCRPGIRQRTYPYMQDHV